MSENTRNLITGRHEGTAADPRGSASTVADARKYVGGGGARNGLFADDDGGSVVPPSSGGRYSREQPTAWVRGQDRLDALREMPSAPPGVTALHELANAVLSACDAGDEAVVRGLSLAGEHASARKAAVREIAEQISGGQPVKPSKLPSLEEAQVVAEAALQVKIDAAVAARKAYDAAHGPAVAKWHKQQRALLPERHERTVKAVHAALEDVHAMVATVDEWRREVSASGVRLQDEVAVGRKLPEALQAAADQLEQHRDRLTGANLGRPVISPSWEQRERLARDDGAVIGSLGWSTDLALIWYRERVERFTFTSWTRRAGNPPDSIILAALPPDARNLNLDWAAWADSAEAEARKREAAEKKS